MKKIIFFLFEIIIIKNNIIKIDLKITSISLNKNCGNLSDFTFIDIQTDDEKFQNKEIIKNIFNISFESFDKKNELIFSCQIDRIQLTYLICELINFDKKFNGPFKMKKLNEFSIDLEIDDEKYEIHFPEIFIEDEIGNTENFYHPKKPICNEIIQNKTFENNVEFNFVFNDFLDEKKLPKFFVDENEISNCKFKNHFEIQCKIKKNEFYKNNIKNYKLFYLNMCNAKEIIGNFIFIENNKKSNFLIIIIIIIILLLLIIFFIIFQKKYKKNSFNLESEINSNYKILKN